MKNYIASTWLGLIRIVLGILVVSKGLVFIYETSLRSSISELSMFGHITAAFVGIVTLSAGMFIIVGLLTRLSASIQIGAVAVALIFMSATGIERSTLAVVSTIVVVTLLVFFAIKGSAAISFDKELERGRTLSI